MKRIKIIIGILIVSLLCSFSANTQDLLSNLLENEDVTWVAETEIYFSLEGTPNRSPVFEHKYSGYQARIETIKISPEIYGKESQTEFLLQELIYESILAGNQNAFNNKGEELTAESFESHFATFRIVEHMDWKINKIVLDTIGSDNFATRGFIIKMLWYYNQKELSIHSDVLSFKPVTDKFIVNNKEVTVTAKGGEANSLNYNDDEVKWCKATKIYGFDFSTAKLLKGNHIQFLKEIFKTNIEHKKYKVYADNYGMELFYHEQLELPEYEERLLEEIDTFVSFHPETYQEQLETAVNPAIDFNKLSSTSFIHYWYWDEKSNALSVELKYIGLPGRIRIKAKQD